MRLYGRYRKGSQFKVDLVADVRGQRLQKSFELSPEEGDNPEIERMWVSTRIEQLLKAANRVESRNSVADQVVRLGERYSIATEFTSFIVLENNEEYRRWKIDRVNADRIDRDRNRQAALRQRLHRIRTDSLARLGPSPAIGPEFSPAKPSSSTKVTPKSKSSKHHTTPEPSSQLLLILGGSWMLLRRRRRRM